MIKVGQGEIRSRTEERGSGVGGCLAGSRGHVGGVVCMGMVCRAHHEPDPTPASNPGAGAEFSDSGMPVAVTKRPVVFETVMLYLASVCSHVDHPSAGGPAPSSVRKRKVFEGEVWLVCTRAMIVGDCE